MKYLPWCINLLAVGLISACSSSSDPEKILPNSEPLTASDYSSMDCAKLSSARVISAGLLGDESVECGLVTVPADWSVDNGTTIKLAVYRIPSTSSTAAADPVVYLEGGPGGSGVALVAEFAVESTLAYLRERSDVFVIDQRGTGYSQPALFCPEVFKATDEEGDVLASHQACHDRLLGDGVNVADYNSAYSAKDINGVRQALGIAEWNLYGLSYGTRLALTVMRDVPDGVRSVILDSVFPPDINGLSETPYVSYWVIDQIATNCAMDAECIASISDIKSVIETGIARLAANPVGELTASAYLEALAEFMTDPQIPAIVSTVAKGTDAEIIVLIDQIEQGGEEEGPLPNDVTPDLYPFTAESDGLAYGVVCGEEAPYLAITAGPNIAANFNETTQRIANNLEYPFNSKACDVYRVPARGEIETKPVQSRIPTLVLAGTADVQTPPAWSRLAADSLENSQYAEFDGKTHGLIGDSNCVNQITLDFLNHPDSTANLDCINHQSGVDYQVE